MHETVVVFPLLLLFVLPQDGGNRRINLRNTVGVCDPNVKESILPPAPKTTSPEVRTGFSTSVSAPTLKDFCCYGQKMGFGFNISAHFAKKGCFEVTD